MKITLNYSPNFDSRKRTAKEIKFIVFHYTGMKKERDAICRLTSQKSKVSTHYLIKRNGEISEWPKTKLDFILYFFNKYLLILKTDLTCSFVNSVYL